MLSFSYLFKTVSMSYGCLLQRYCHFSMTQRWVAVIQNTEQSSCSAVGNSVESELSVIQNSAQSLGHRWVTVFYIWIDEPKQIHILCLSAVPDSAELSCSAVRETIELKLSAGNYIDDPLYFLIILVFCTKKKARSQRLITVPDSAQSTQLQGWSRGINVSGTLNCTST